MKIRICRDHRVLTIHDDEQPHTLAYTVLAHDGLGTPPVERIRLRGWRQDGETDLGTVLRPRRITLVVLIDPYRLRSSDYDTLRRNLLSLLCPDQEVTIEFQTGGTVRSLRAALIDAVTAPSADIHVDRQRLTLSLEASDPLFYALSPQTLTWAGSGQGLSVPLAVPVTMSDASLTSVLTFASDGTYPTSCQVTVRGPCATVALTLSGVQIGYGALSTGRELRLDSAWGRVSATEHDAATGALIANRLAGVTGDLTKLRVQPGSNQASVAVTGGNPQTSVTLVYTPAYLSL